MKKLLPKLNDTLLSNDYKSIFGESPSNDTNYINDWVSSGWIGLFHLDMVLSRAIEMGASDVHIIGGQTVCFTILGEIVKMNEFVIPDEEIMTDLSLSLLNHQMTSEYIKDFEDDFSYVIRFGLFVGRRFRANIGKSFGMDQITFRVINENIPRKDELGIDESVDSLFENSSGVVLICGSTGSGKSTTLASIIRDIQLRKSLKIITIEKPIEYIYPTDGKSLIVQRAIPEDCLSFSNGLTSAMRSAPDIILIGEVRNREEVDELLRSAETGHLSLSTLHTSNNITTLNRIRSLYEGDEQRRILSTLGDTLRGIVNQVLVKSIDGKSRFAVREVLKVDFNVRKLIAEDRMSEIRLMQEASRSTMEHLLLKCCLNGMCLLIEARSKAPDQTYFDELYNQLTIEEKRIVNNHSNIVNNKDIQQEQFSKLFDELLNDE